MTSLRKWSIGVVPGNNLTKKLLFWIVQSGHLQQSLPGTRSRVKHTNNTKGRLTKGLRLSPFWRQATWRTWVLSAVLSSNSPPLPSNSYKHDKMAQESDLQRQEKRVQQVTTATQECLSPSLFLLCWVSAMILWLVWCHWPWLELMHIHTTLHKHTHSSSVVSSWLASMKSLRSRNNST